MKRLLLLVAVMVGVAVLRKMRLDESDRVTGYRTK
jgi:hypothetical protein